MRKILSLVLAMVVACSMSVSAQKKKVAVVTFYGDKYIDFSELDGGASLAAMVATLSKDPNFDIKSIVNKFHDSFFNDLAKDFPFDLVPEENIIKSPEYMAYNFGSAEASESKNAELYSNYVVADGYKPLREAISKKNKHELKMLEMFGKDVDGVMFVYLDFQFVKKFAMGGTGTAGMRAYARIKLWNKTGDKVFVVNESANSSKTVGIIGGVPVMKADKLLPLCQDAAEQLLIDLKKRMPKLVGKVEKKL